MTTITAMVPQDLKEHQEHELWLKDCAKWRADHRTTLGILAKVQSAILEQEAALEIHEAAIQAHEVHLQKYQLTDFLPDDPDFEYMEQEHCDLENQHQQTKVAHDRIKKHHLCVQEVVASLLEKCQEAM